MSVSEGARASGLTSEQVDFFNENGYLIIPNELPPETIDKLLVRSHELLRSFSLEGHPMTKFTSEHGKNKKHVGDKYFLESGDKVRFFFEEDAFDENGILIKPKHLAINKIGHALHLFEPEFRNITFSRRNLSIAYSLNFENPKVLQSMIICKQPEIGGAVIPHQDSTFLYTEPPSAVGFWYALEDANQENGCLSFVPGSHRWEPIRKRLVRVKSGDGEGVDTGFIKLPEGAGDGLEGRKAREDDGDVGEDKYIMGEVKKGSLVLIHGNVLHKSERNTSKGSRHIYTFHVINGNYKYDDLNWLQPGPEGFPSLRHEVESEKRT